MILKVAQPLLGEALPLFLGEGVREIPRGLPEPLASGAAVIGGPSRTLELAKRLADRFWSTIPQALLLSLARLNHRALLRRRFRPANRAWLRFLARACGCIR